MNLIDKLLKIAPKKSSKIENNKYPGGRARSARAFGAPPKVALCCSQLLLAFLYGLQYIVNEVHLCSGFSDGQKRL